jgi:hypothetical protein
VEVIRGKWHANCGQCVYAKRIQWFILCFIWCEINVTLWEANTRILRVFENRILEGIFGDKTKEYTGEKENYTMRS